MICSGLPIDRNRMQSPHMYQSRCQMRVQRKKRQVWLSLHEVVHAASDEILRVAKEPCLGWMLRGYAIL
jgi:hypothetical protein